MGEYNGMSHEDLIAEIKALKEECRAGNEVATLLQRLNHYKNDEHHPEKKVGLKEFEVGIGQKRLDYFVKYGLTEPYEDDAFSVNPNGRVQAKCHQCYSHPDDHGSDDKETQAIVAEKAGFVKRDKKYSDYPFCYLCPKCTEHVEKFEKDKKRSIDVFGSLEYCLHEECHKVAVYLDPGTGVKYCESHRQTERSTQ